MGRKVRMVPADWQHPKDGDRYIPLMGGSYAEAAARWDEEQAQWARGFVDDWNGGWKPKEDHHDGFYEDYAGERPEPQDYMPDWPADQRTHFMMYEDTSEGTPISPAFATAEELAAWLEETGASAFAGMTATYGQWLSTIRRGWAVSAVMEAGQMKSGVEALASKETDMTDIVGELKGFAHCCGASEAGNGAFRVVSLSGVGSDETERNLRAVLRDGSAEITRLRALVEEMGKALDPFAKAADEADKLDAGLGLSPRRADRVIPMPAGFFRRARTTLAKAKEQS
jgi:hypothetical protein